jgi:DNA-binding XRE family transcriptional regulator
MSSTLVRHRRQTEGYARITGARFANDSLYVSFADGEEACLPVARFENPSILGQTPDWSRVKPAGHEVLVPSAGGDLGIPWDTIRALTDPQFAEKWTDMADHASHTLGQGIQRLRKARGLGRAELAKRVRVTSDTIEDLEAGNLPADLEFAVQVLQAMDHTLDDLTESSLERSA